MANLISKIDGHFIHDASAFHMMVPEVSTYKVTLGDANSQYKTTISIGLPSDVMLKAQADALVYKGVINASLVSEYPGAYIPASRVGYTRKVGSAGYIAGVLVEVGDMIICNTSTSQPENTSTHFDFIQSNLDPNLYSLKGHTHKFTASTNTTSDGGFTPAGTVDTSVFGAPTTFKGSYTPAGSVTASFSTTSTAHSHSFTGIAATITMTYKKSDTITGNSNASLDGSIADHNYTPDGSVLTTLSYTTESVTDTTHSLAAAAHSHTFNGSLTTFSGSYTPEGTISGSYSTTSTAHKHSFTGTSATISVSYDKAASATGGKGAEVTGTINAHTYTPAGTVQTSVTYDTTAATVSYDLNAASHSHSFSGSLTTFSGSYTPEGTISGSYSTSSSHSHSFKGTADTINLSYQKSASNTGNATAPLNGSISDHSYQPGGSISTIVGYTKTDVEDTTHSLSAATHTHTYSTTVASSGSYKPTGTISTPSITTTLSSTSFTYATGVIASSDYSYTTSTVSQAVMSTWTYTTATEELNFTTATPTYQKLTAITLTTASSGNILTNVTAGSSKPTFYGDSATINVSGTAAGTTGASGALSVTGTIGAKYQKATSVTATFTGTTATISHSHTLSVANHSHSISLTSTNIKTSYTPAGTIDTATITTSGSLTSATFYGKAETIKTSGMPLGTTGMSGALAVSGSIGANYSKAVNPISTFSGAITTLSHTFDLDAASHTHDITLTPTTTSTSYTPAGTLDDKTVDVSGSITATFYGKADTIKTSGTPLGTTSNSTTLSITGTIGAKYQKATSATSTFTGTTATITHSHTLSVANHKHSIALADTNITASYTPAGTLNEETVDVSASFNPTFTGTTATISVSGTPLLLKPTSTFTGTAVAAHTHSITLTNIETSTDSQPVA